MIDFRKSMFILPNLCTLSSVFCSFFAIHFAINYARDIHSSSSYLVSGCLLVLLSIVFDSFDGKVARWTKTSSAFGMELDSLADAVSFGVAPAVLVYCYSLWQLELWGFIACFIFLCCALLRLARFNVEAPPEGVQKFFKGIPSPGAAAVVIAVVLFLVDKEYVLSEIHQILLAIFVAFVGLLMVSGVRYKTYKGKDFKVNDYLFILGGIAIFIGLSLYYNVYSGFMGLVLYYVFGGLFSTIKGSFRLALNKRRSRYELSE